LTQEFFARLLAREYLQNLHHQEGKFRSFLLAYVKNFLLEQGRRGRAQKRGGGCEFISLNQPVGEAGYLLEPVDDLGRAFGRGCVPIELASRHRCLQVAAGSGRLAGHLRLTDSVAFERGAARIPLPHTLLEDRDATSERPPQRQDRDTT